MTSVFSSSILLVGAGKMGGALARRWLDAGLAPQSFIIVDTNPQTIKLFEGVQVLASADYVPTSFVPDCIVLAVKPQTMESVLPELAKRFKASHTLYLSIAAGKKIQYFERCFGPHAAIIRAMPNTPAVIGQGVTAWAANASVTRHHKELAQTLLKAAGAVMEVEDESLMDAVTAISGSGPAYVFLFMEALITAGMQLGLPEDAAKQLVLHTVIGSAKLVNRSPDDLATLRRNVTSKGGTTEAALEVLTSKQFTQILEQAVQAANKRALELS